MANSFLVMFLRLNLVYLGPTSVLDETNKKKEYVKKTELKYLTCEKTYISHCHPYCLKVRDYVLQTNIFLSKTS